MTTQHFVFTIDGAAGTGKTTVARELAKRLGTEYLDTGAMYRAIAVIAVDHGIDPEDGVALAAALEKRGVRFDWEQVPPAILLGGKDVSQRIRDLDISSVVSIVAKHPEVRKVLVKQQRKIRDDRSMLVAEGRDQGSVVFPDAPVRFFLVADMDERTNRRVKQLRELGSEVEVETVQQDIQARDHIDSTREASPLICPDGAIRIDTSDKTIEEVTDIMEDAVRSFLSA